MAYASQDHAYSVLSNALLTLKGMRYTPEEIAQALARAMSEANIPRATLNAQYETLGL